MLEGFTEVIENIKETVEDIGENIKETVSELTQQKEAAVAEGDTEYANYYESSIEETELGTHQGEALETNEADVSIEDPEYANYYEQAQSNQGKGEISFGSGGIERAKRDIEWAEKHGFEGHLRRAQQRLTNEYVKEAQRKAEK